MFSTTYNSTNQQQQCSKFINKNTFTDMNHNNQNTARKYFAHNYFDEQCDDQDMLDPSGEDQYESDVYNPFEKSDDQNHQSVAQYQDPYDPSNDYFDVKSELADNSDNRSDKTTICEVCHQTIAYKNKARHMAEKHGDTRWLCPVKQCNSSYSRLYSLRGHLYDKHSRDAPLTKREWTLTTRQIISVILEKNVKIEKTSTTTSARRVYSYII